MLIALSYDLAFTIHSLDRVDCHLTLFFDIPSYDTVVIETTLRVSLEWRNSDPQIGHIRVLFL